MTNDVERERRRQQAIQQRDQADAALLELERKEQRRWEKDRAYDHHVHGNNCSRRFFEEIKEARIYSHIEKLRGPHGNTYTSMPDLHREAKRYFGAPGSILICSAKKGGRRGIVASASCKHYAMTNVQFQNTCAAA